MRTDAPRAVMIACLTLLFAGAGRAHARVQITQQGAAPPAGIAAVAPSTPAPPLQEPSPLAPPAGALRAAERVQLTGLELGTMWTFENAPLDQWQQRHGFRPTTEWLDHVRLASVRLGDFCSASFVSATGLIATNHHCARACVEAQSKSGTDYVAAGFYAPLRKDEKLCPDLYVDQLIEIQNVTERVTHAGPQGSAEAQLAAAEEGERKKIESECAAASKLVCEVVTLYHGGQYQLYKYRRWAPIKLVFAPELNAGFFGGDPDNFTYPRYDLDVSFLRAYGPDNAPARTPDYFKWRAEGAKEGELVFVTGNPGTTNRMATVAQLMYERVYRHPFLIGYLDAQRSELLEMAKGGPKAQQEARENLFEVENSLKALRGEEGGLLDTLLMGHKIKWEREFQQKVNSDVALHAQYGDVWDRLQSIAGQKLRISPRFNFSNLDFFAPPQLQMAAMLVRYVHQMALPEAQRAEDFRTPKVAQAQQMLSTDIPVDASAGARMLQDRIALLKPWLPADESMLHTLMRPGETVEQAAQRTIKTSQVADAAFRRALMQAGAAAVDTSSDPMIVLARALESNARDLAQQWQQVLASEKVQQERLARALFAVYGTKLPPDATFTLRISDGEVHGYPYNGTLAPAFTSIYGLYARAAEFGNKDPFTLPKGFAEHRAAVNMSTPLDFVATTDITGGNSGSPIIDREARVVGLAFDNNIEGLPNQFLFTTEAARTVGVHSAGITEALRNVYHATALLAELIGPAPTGKH